MITKTTFKIHSGTPINNDSSYCSERSKNKNKNSEDVLLRLNSNVVYESKESVDKFQLTYNMLISIGFLPRQINNCYRLYRCENMREFVELLVKTNGKYSHKFIPSFSNELICDLCEESINQHNIFHQSDLELDNISNINLNNTKKFSHEEIEKKKLQTINFLKKMSSEDKNAKYSMYDKHVKSLMNPMIKTDSDIGAFAQLNKVKSHAEEMGVNNFITSNKTLTEIKESSNKKNTDPIYSEKESRDGDYPLETEVLKKKQISNIKNDISSIRNDFSVNLDIPNSQESEENENDYTLCEICEEKIFLPSLPPIYKLSCQHFFCSECFDYYLQNEINNGNVKSLRCPHINCDVVFSKTEICDFLLLTSNSEEDIETKKTLYDKYLKFLKNHEVEDDKKKFYCPWPNCEGIGIIDRELEFQEVINTTVKCNINSEHEFCVLCGNKKHEGGCMSDQEAEILRQVKAKELKLKKCPGCRNWTEKKGGCNHMTCVHCKYEWCWICNGASPPDHFNVPGTKCYQRQFPNDNRDDFEEFNEDDFNRAVLDAENPNNPVRQALQFEQLRRPDPNWFETDDSWTFEKEYYSRLNYTAVTYTSDGCDRFCLCLGDTLMAFFMIFINFFGNPLIVFLHRRNKVVLFNHLRLHEKTGLESFPYYAYMMGIVIYWIIFYINSLVFSIIMFVFHLFNGSILNCIRSENRLIE